MARTAEKTASTLISIYKETFATESYNWYCISWPELRSIAGVSKLTEEYIRDINFELSGHDYVLIPLDNSLLLAQQCDLTGARAVPARIVEQNLPDDGDDDDDEDLDEMEFNDDDDEDSETEDAESTDEVRSCGWKPKFRTRPFKKADDPVEETE